MSAEAAASIAISKQTPIVILFPLHFPPLCSAAYLLQTSNSTKQIIACVYPIHTHTAREEKKTHQPNVKHLNNLFCNKHLIVWWLAKISKIITISISCDALQLFLLTVYHPAIWPIQQRALSFAIWANSWHPHGNVDRIIFFFRWPLLLFVFTARLAKCCGPFCHFPPISPHRPPRLFRSLACAHTPFSKWNKNKVDIMCFSVI